MAQLAQGVIFLAETYRQDFATLVMASVMPEVRVCAFHFIYFRDKQVFTLCAIPSFVSAHS